MTEFCRIELQQESGIKELTSVRKLRPLLVTLIFVCGLVILPLAVWDNLTNTVISSVVYNLAFIITFIFFISVSTYNGWKLTKILGKNWRSTQATSAFKIFLQKVSALPLNET